MGSALVGLMTIEEGLCKPALSSLLTFNYYDIIFRSKLAGSKNVRKTPMDGPGEAPEDDQEDAGIVIVEDEPDVDREKINEMRRAYLEEARSQDTSD